MVKKTRTKKVESESENDSDIEIDDDSSTQINLTALSSKAISKLFIVPKSIENSAAGWKNIEAISLPHPRAGNPALFLVDTSPKGKMPTSSHFLYEILTFDQPLRSWFVDDEVISDGNLRVVTPFDPLFMILPILQKSTQMRPLSDHLCEAVPPKVGEIICRRLTSSDLDNIATKKDVDAELTVYSYNEDKSLAWLAKKVDKTSRFLKERDIHRSEASVSSNFTTIPASKRDEKDYLRYACDIIGDYLDDSLKKKLLTKVGLPAEADRKRERKSDGLDSGEHDGLAKKLKVTAEGREETNVPVQPLEDYSNSKSTPVAPKEIKGKQKELQKAAKGTASLFKFFSPSATKKK